MEWKLDDPTSGPVEKFYLLKVNAALLRRGGFRLEDLQRMDCADIRGAIAEAKAKEQ